MADLRENLNHPPAPGRLLDMPSQRTVLSATANGAAGATERGEMIAALFRTHYGDMYRLAFVILGDAAIAEEIVMDAFLRTLRGWHRLREPDRAAFYLRRTVVNLCRSRIRRKSVELRAAARLYGSRAREEDLPAMAAEDLELWDAVRSLPPRQRACVVLRYHEDLTEQQIAALLDCSVGTVKSQLSRARSRLAHEINREGLR
ncbi:MAG: SigE family RNA polymerase sigma factor [Actinomycetota bacterium]